MRNTPNLCLISNGLFRELFELSLCVCAFIIEFELMEYGMLKDYLYVQCYLRQFWLLP